MPDAQVLLMPDVPSKVDLNDLHDREHLRLLAESETRLIEIIMKDSPVGRYSKKELGSKMFAFCKNKTPDELKQLGIEAWPPFRRKATQGIVKDQNPDGSFAMYAVYKGIKWGKELGKGQFGKVKLVQNIKDGEWSVLKVMKSSDDVDYYIGKEHAALTASENSSGKILTREKSSETQHNFIMKYASGVELYKFVCTKPRLSATQWLDIALDAANNLNHIHELGYIHRDIKLANMVHNPAENKTAIVDLGLATKMDDNKMIMSGMAGSHIAPELTDEERIECSTEIDVYSLGVSLKQLLGFDEVHHTIEVMRYDVNAELYTDYIEDNFKTTSLFSSDKEFKKLLDDMTDNNPQKRPPLSVVIEKLQDLRKNLLPIYQMTTGIIQVEDYKNSKDKMAFINALKSVDTVILADSKEQNMDDYRKLQQALEKRGIVVRKEILISSDPSDLVEKAREMDNNRKGERAMISQIFYFHPKGQHISLDKAQAQAIKVTNTKKNYRKEVINSQHRSVTETQYENAINILFNEVNLMQNKKTKSLVNKSNTDIEIKHINQLEATINSIINHKRNNKLTYSVLKNELTVLEKSLMSNNKKSGIHLGFIKPREDRAATASLAAIAKKVNKLANETKPELQIPKMRH